MLHVLYVYLQNFLRNSLRVRNPGLMAQVWDLIMAHTEKVHVVFSGKARKCRERNCYKNRSNEKHRQIEFVILV